MTARGRSGVWRLMLVGERSGAENMARDAALTDRARETGETVLAVYRWSRPTLSFGRNQTARGCYDEHEILRRGIDVVRRPTGGRALLHHREVTYSVTSRTRDDESLRDAYRRINAIVIRGLSLLGVVAQESPRSETATLPGQLPCFALPSEGELVVGDRKLVGSAQVRADGALLQHGSILLDDDQSIIGDLLTEKKANGRTPATLKEVMGRMPDAAEVAEALFVAVRELEDPSASPLDERELSRATAEHLDRYQTKWWTWRR